MAQKLIQDLSNCSKTCKNSLGLFFNKLFQTVQEQSNIIPGIQNQLTQIFNRITEQFSIKKARDISKDERSQKLLIDHQFNYGEITFHSIYLIFQKIRSIRKIKSHQIFYDLGSGTGKVVFAAALCYPFNNCIGIEYLQSLFDISSNLKLRIEQNRLDIDQQLHELQQSERLQSEFSFIQFINQDFKKIDWSDGSIIFVSSTCYSRQVMNQIGELCQKLQKDTIVITMTRRLQNLPFMKVVERFEGSTSWGVSNIFIHVKQI